MTIRALLSVKGGMVLRDKNNQNSLPWATPTLEIKKPSHLLRPTFFTPIKPQILIHHSLNMNVLCTFGTFSTVHS